MSDPTSAAPTPGRAKRRFPRRLIVALTLLMPLALLTVFEVGVRLIQPDKLTYTATVGEGQVMQPTYHHVQMTITDPHTVAQWYAAVSANPLHLNQNNVFISTFVHCNGMRFFSDSYRFEFSWHGLPLEAVTTSSDNNCGPALWLSSGGLTDPREYALPSDLPGATP